MEFSKSELLVMEMLWDGECLDENGEIQALNLAEILMEKHGWKKTSCYTYFGRLLDKGAISRRYPKYTMKPIVSRDEALKSEREEAIKRLFQGSILNVVRTYLNSDKANEEEIKEMKKIINEFDE